MTVLRIAVTTAEGEDIITVPLDRQCPRCLATLAPYKCGHCRHGRVPTENGQAIIDFVDRYR